MPGQSEVKPSPSSSMSSTSTVSMSPGFAPATSIGPGGAVDEGQRHVGWRELLADMA